MSTIPNVDTAASTVAGGSGESSASQTQYVLTSSDGQEVIIDAQALEGGGLVQGATVQVVEGGQEVTYALQAAGDDDESVVAAALANRVSSAGTGATEGDTFIISSDGTAYTTNTDGTLQRKVIASKDGLKQESIDRSFQYYDNIRGKINSEVLKELVEKHNAESPNLSKNDRLHQWGLVAREYCQVTGQQKSRTTLMKKMTSAKYYRDHEGRPVEEGGTIKGRSVKREAGGGVGGDIENQDPEMPDPEAKKKIRLYDQMRLEALRLERDAQRALLENAQIEGDKLKKEASILDVQLEIMKIDLAIRKEEALKVGVVFEMADADVPTDQDEVGIDHEVMAAAEQMAAEVAGQSETEGEAEPTVQVENADEDQVGEPEKKRQRT